MIETKIIDAAHKGDIRVKNDPFPLWGRLVPSYQNRVWGYGIEEFAPEKRGEMCFPDEPYDYDKMAPSTFFVGAYEDGMMMKPNGAK